MFAFPRFSKHHDSWEHVLFTDVSLEPSTEPDT